MAKKLDRLFEIFAAEYVQLILDKDIESSTQTESKISTMKTPISVEGYLTEMDDDYLYIGHIPNTISQAVSKEYLIHICVTEPKGVMDELMEAGEVPQEKGKWN